MYRNLFRAALAAITLLINPVVNGAENEVPQKRWGSFAQVTQGARVFQANCAACHGDKAQGTANWKQSGPDGKFPPPPLDGRGHAWHHPLKLLFQIVKFGSPGGQGNMPAWGGKLSDEDIVAVLAWLQSRWPNDIYKAWVERDRASR